MTAERKGTIAVTGASRGIGAEIALELARRGFTVACLTRKGTGIEKTSVSHELKKRLIAMVCDVTDEASLKKAFASIGAFNGLVNNAGIHLGGKSAEQATDVYDQIM